MEKTRVLLVDDDETFLGFLEDLIREDGYEAVSVLSAEEGLRKLKEDSFAAAVLDLNLGGWISGLELAREIRRQYPMTQVIVVSGLSDSTTRQVAVNAGAVAFFEKPIAHPDSLLTRIREAVSSMEAEKQP